VASRIRLRDPARQDIDDAVDHYFAEAGETVAFGFVEALDAAYNAIRELPAAGSPRYAIMLGVADLRCRKLGRYPYLTFYVDTGSEIEVWRVLHTSRDIPASLQDQ